MKTGLTIGVVALVILLAGAFYVQQRMPELPAISSLPGIGPSSEVEGALPAGSTIPALAGIAGWINTPGNRALTPADLAGKVVLVDFWTYSCINCIRTLPYLTDWHAKYADKGLVILGIHTPEFAFEQERANVERAVAKYGIRYPVAQDNGYETWNNFGNQYWPAEYLYDASGKLVRTHFGEGRYDETEAAIRELLAAAGATVDMPMTEEVAAPDFSQLGSPETYVNTSRGTRFANARIVPDAETAYEAPAELSRNRVALDGRWTVGEESAASGAGARILYRFVAAQANLVMGAPDGAARVRVRLNGKPVPPEARPAGMTVIGGETYVTVRDKDLYTLINKPGDYEEALLELDFETSGTEAYAFTFG